MVSFVNYVYISTLFKTWLQHTVCDQSRNLLSDKCQQIDFRKTIKLTLKNPASVMTDPNADKINNVHASNVKFVTI